MINTVSKSKLLVLIIGVLLLANIVLLYFFLEHKGGRKDKYSERKTAIANFLEKEIAFSNGQLHQYDSLSEKNRTETRRLFDSMRSNKEDQLKQLAKEGFSDSAISNMAGMSADKQKDIEVQMLQHVKEVRKLCTASQLVAFDSLFYTMLNHRHNEKRKDK